MFRKSLTKFDIFGVSMASLLLSSKIEESPKLLREVNQNNIVFTIF